ncbi:MAG TPA: hypothetical protein VHA76_00315 [Solirubrobacterales bacterium]|nr:hypothetical protein [Solirubrobacterales bacterium]
MVMAIAGIALGVDVEGKAPASIARPLSAAKGRLGGRKTGSKVESGSAPPAAMV